MGTCCGGDTELHARCPRTGTIAPTVDLLTVKALLIETALRRLRPGPHRFCPEPTCDVVYFDEVGNVFTKIDVRVSVWQKEAAGEGTVCYCFGENEADIRTEIERSGTSHAVRRVRDHIDAGRCACEVRNPRGVCCLGDVTQAVERMQAVEVPATRK